MNRSSEARVAPAAAARRGGGPRLPRLDRRGQSFVELAGCIPLLLLLVCGIVEIARMIETTHIMSSLTREGANIASRGALMEDAVAATRANQLASGLGNDGGVIVSRIRVDNGVPRVEAQLTNEANGHASRVAPTDSIADLFRNAGLRDGHRYYVVELFVPYRPITPLRIFMENLIPETLYDLSLF